MRIICRKHFEETVKERQTIKLDHFPRVGGADIAGLRENKRRYALAMALGAAFGWLDRQARRFNSWFGSAAIAASAEHSGAAGGPPTLDPAAVVAALGEIERGSEKERESPEDR